MRCLDSALPLGVVSIAFIGDSRSSRGRRARMRRPRVLRALLVALMAVMIVTPGTALGAKPIAQFHDHFTESRSDEICGIPVDLDVVVTDNFFLYADGTFKDTSSV